MEILKFNVFDFLNKSKKTTVPLVFLYPTFPYHVTDDDEKVNWIVLVKYKTRFITKNQDCYAL